MRKRLKGYRYIAFILLLVNFIGGGWKEPAIMYLWCGRAIYLSYNVHLFIT